MSDVFNKKDWIDRQSQFPTRRRLTNVQTSEEMVVDVAREEGTVQVAGHPFNAAGMNDLEDRIGNAIDTLQSNFQDGVDSIYNACVDKGSTPSSHALADVVEAIGNISGGVEEDIFGTPSSNTPDNAEISTQYPIYGNYEAYKAFGDNESCWISDAITKRDKLYFKFTDDSLYIPTHIELCPYFDYSGRTVESIVVGMYGSNDGENWKALKALRPDGKNNIVSAELDVKEYYNQFYFECFCDRNKAGLKNVRCYGIKKSSSGGGGMDTIKNVSFVISCIDSNMTEIGGNGNGDDVFHAT